jgi:BON domain
MTAAPSSSDAIHPLPDSSWSGDDALRTAALKLLQSSGFAALRRLRCDVIEAVVIVQGVVPSYYLKQMAQATILRLDGIRNVKNLVEVGGTCWVQQVNEDEGIAPFTRDQCDGS